MRGCSTGLHPATAVQRISGSIRGRSRTGLPSVFDDFSWWDERDVLTQITPARLGYLQSVAGDLAGRRVLDLGCGGGMLAEPLARAGARVCGIDVSRNAVAAAREHARHSGLGIDYLRAAAEELPFGAGSLDLVVAFDVLEHVDDLARVVQEIARTLRPGGRLIYETMNRTVLGRVVAIWIGEHLWRGGPPKGTHDWHKFIKPHELVGLMGRYGIANLETRGFMPVGIDRKGRLRMALVPYQGLSYVGYGVRTN